MKLYHWLSVFFLIGLLACGGGVAPVSDSTAPNATDWLVDTNFVRDGGPGKDGIPSLDFPEFITANSVTFLADSEMVVGTKINGVIRALPHKILDWHEVVNLETNGDNHAFSYCPLTGSAGLWSVPARFTNKTFGVSGLLYNSNLILYDRETDSNWPQMFNQAANGQLIGEKAVTHAVIETTWGSWKQMYPNTTLLSNNTGFSRDYEVYPYDNYLTDNTLLFALSRQDSRLHLKTRVLGVADANVNIVYPLNDFSINIQTINEVFATSEFVVVGSSQINFAIAFESRLSDGTLLTFTPVDSALPIVMQDNEGNQWNVFGEAVSGPRQGTKLKLKSDYIAFWLAWVPYHPSPTIHVF
ncbi:MAG: DUF3179 domain-containing protein [Enterobacterales bacterium]|nr:DUF3179 domain-containing protein [Enterobacterales bacterium]